MILALNNFKTIFIKRMNFLCAVSKTVYCLTLKKQLNVTNHCFKNVFSYYCKNYKIGGRQIKRFLFTSSADDSPIKIIKGKKRIRISSSSSENESDDSAPKRKRGKSSKKNQTSATENANSPAETSVKNDESSKETEIEKQDGIKFDSSPEKGDKAENEFKGFMQSPSEKIDSYDPFTAGYHPIKSACWKHGEMVPFYALARTFELIGDISGRMKSMEILSNYLRSVMVLTPKDLLPSIYLTLNKIGPAYEGAELGMSEQTLIQVVAKSSGRNVSQIKSLIQKLGDIGLVGEKIKSSQRLLWKPKPMTVRGIFDKFKVIANTTGGDAVKKKIGIAVEMFAACNATEAKFLMRALNTNLRIGIGELSILKALALACATTPPEQSYPPKNINAACNMTPQSFKSLVNDLTLTLRTIYCECPNYDVIIPVLLELGVSALPDICRLTVGVPTKPMLAQPTKGVQDVLTRFDGLKFTCEWKYDGERAQIHYTEEGVVKIFSRNLEDNTSKYPDIISRIGLTKKEGVNSFILDCEVVAWNKEENQIMPFQVLSKRKKKDATKSEIEVIVCVFMFDLLYLNGRSLVKKKFLERRQLLHENFNKVHGEWMFPSFIDTSKMEEVQEFLEESVKGNCEGLMVKTLEEEATYEIAKRSRNWLKLKKDYLDGVGDTLDLVVLGGYLGKGRRTGTYGGFLVGCYDPDSEEYQSVCKLGTGFSDEALTAHSEFFKNHIMNAAPSYYQHDSTLEPDHWFEPVQVWEIKCADISLSPIHRAAVGVVDPKKGISLRFPRFIRIRDDKKPEDATTSEQLIIMYNNQEQVKSQQRKSSKQNEDEFY